MEGIIFFWVFWVLWVVTTFFLHHNHPHRLKYSAVILLTITLSIQKITISGVTISVASIILVFYVYLEMAKWRMRSQIYFIITAFILMLSFVSFQLFELYDPVWLLFDRTWMFAAILTYITLLIHEETKKRLMVLVFGCVHGEIIYSLAMETHFNSPIGSMAFFDVMSLAVLFIFLWNGLERITMHFENHANHLAKGKVKQS